MGRVLTCGIISALVARATGVAIFMGAKPGTNAAATPTQPAMRTAFISELFPGLRPPISALMTADELTWRNSRARTFCLTVTSMRGSGIHTSQLVLPARAHIHALLNASRQSPDYKCSV